MTGRRQVAGRAARGYCCRLCATALPPALLFCGDVTEHSAVNHAAPRAPLGVGGKADGKGLQGRRKKGMRVWEGERERLEDIELDKIIEEKDWK